MNHITTFLHLGISYDYNNAYNTINVKIIDEYIQIKIIGVFYVLKYYYTETIYNINVTYKIKCYKTTLIWNIPTACYEGEIL